MVMACCQFSGVRFIEMDKSINKSFLVKHFGETATFVYKKEPHPFSSVRRPLPDMDVLYIVHDGQETTLCSCDCHINDPNMYVMH